MQFGLGSRTTRTAIPGFRPRGFHPELFCAFPSGTCPNEARIFRADLPTPVARATSGQDIGAGTESVKHKTERPPRRMAVLAADSNPCRLPLVLAPVDEVAES